MDPVCPLDYRYGRKDLKQIFGEEKRLQFLLDIEAALARAHATVGNIPKKSADEICKKASTKYVKVERVKEIEAETKHDIMAVTQALAEQCKGDAGKYVHLGATSYDIVDSANALQFSPDVLIIHARPISAAVTAYAIRSSHQHQTLDTGPDHHLGRLRCPPLLHPRSELA